MEEISEKGIAEDLADSQKSISISEFFERNKHMLGFDSEARAIVTAVKEGVDNALDATEDAEILPEVKVIIEEGQKYYTIILEDNGPGIPKDNIPKVFGKLLYGSRFHKREQNRGQQGIGISAAVLYSQLTSGEPAIITSKTQESDKADRFHLVMDTENNTPDIKRHEKVETDKEHGTKIELKMEANMRGRKTLHKYIKNTAVVNPHARIVIDEPKERIEYERVSEKLPAKTEEIKPHPHGVDLGTLIKMIEDTNSYSVSGFLQEEFSKVGEKTADGIINGFLDSYYGRDLKLSTKSLNLSDVEKHTKEAVSRKKEEEVELFAEKIYSIMQEEDSISYSGLEKAVETSAEELEKEKDTRFGKTVREKTHKELWNLFDVNTCYRTIESLVKEATSKRKSKLTIQKIAYSITVEFEKHDKYRINENLLDNIVDISCNKVVESGNHSIGQTARQNITEEIWKNMKTLEKDIPKIREFKDDRDMSRSLLKGMTKQKVNKPSDKCLSPIGPDQIEKGLRKEYDADFYSSAQRSGGVYKGSPVIVEAGIAYGGEIMDQNDIELQRYANRVPLVYQKGACSITNVVEEIGWRNYNLKQPSNRGMPQGPVVLIVHVASTNIPFTSESKDAIANVPDIETKIERAVRDVGRDLKNHIKKERELSKRREKENVITEILPEMANKLAEVSSKDSPNTSKSLAKIMNSILVDTDNMEIKNYSNSSEEFEIVGDDEELWSGKLSKGETIELDSNVEELEVNNIEEEKYILD